MKTIKKEHMELYERYGKPHYDSLKKIDSYQEYMKWQNIMDEIVGKEKRVLMDVIWYSRNPKINR